LRYLAIILVLAAILFIFGCSRTRRRPTKVVKICSVSGQLAGEYCPPDVVVDRRFYLDPKPGEAVKPTTYCGIHREPEPTPKPGPPWIGTSFYQAISSPIEDVFWFIDQVATAGGNCTEFFLVFNWAGPEWQPYALVDWHFKDGDYDIPIWDLGRWNMPVWEKWEKIFGHCRMMGVVPFIRILDFCSIKGRIKLVDGREMEAKRVFCFRSNVQRLVQDKLPGGLWGEPIRAHYGALNEKLLDTLQAAGCETYFVAPSNEADVILDTWTEEQGNQVLVDQFGWFIQDLTSRGVPRERIIINSSRAFEIIMMEWPDLIYEIHGCNSPGRMMEYFDTWPGKRLFPNGDGVDPYAKGRQGDLPTKREPSIVQAHAMRTLLIDRFGYAYFNRSTEDAPSDIRRADFDVLKSLSGGLSTLTIFCNRMNR